MGLRAAAIAVLAFLAAVPAAAADDGRSVVLVGVHDPAGEAAIEHVRSGGAGVVLFGGAVTDRRQVVRLTQRLQCAANRPIIVSVDHEPGPVARLEGLVGPLPDPWAVDPATLHIASEFVGRDLASLGITLDLAPVADVDVFGSGVLRGRSFGSTPEDVGERVVSFVTGMGAARIGTTLKHFPGHGATPGDTHRSSPVVAGDLADLDAHLAPFRAGIEAGASAVMMGHPRYDAFDPSLPASLSPAAYALLRSGGFEGPAITDGLAMTAIRSFGSLGDVAVAALSAGADLLLVENPADASAVATAIREAMAKGLLDESRVREAIGRAEWLSASVATPACVGATVRLTPLHRGR